MFSQRNPARTALLTANWEQPEKLKDLLAQRDCRYHRARALDIFRRAGDGSVQISSAVEALACGTPIAALGAGGVCDIVTEPALGVLYSVDERDGLSGALDKIQQNRFNKMKLRAQAEMFSNARFLEKFERVLASPMPVPEGRIA